MNKDCLLFGITGATGVLGRSIQRHSCLSNGVPIVWQPFRGDITNGADLEAFTSQFSRFDAVYHFAAKVPVKEVERDRVRSFDVNVCSTLRLLEGLQLTENKPWFFLASSSHVYRPSLQPLSEGAEVAPTGWYGMTKLEADLMGQFYYNSYRTPVCIGRIFSFSHPRQAPPYFLPSLIERIKNAPANAVLEVPGILGTRDFSDADQITDSILSLFSQKFCGTVNIASGYSFCLGDIVQKILERLNRPDITIVPLEEGTMHLNADISLLKSLGIYPPPSLDSLLNKMIKD